MGASKKTATRENLQLSALHDGELSPEEVRKLEARIAQDNQLRAERESFVALDRLLEQWPEPSSYPDLRASVLARVARQREAAAQAAAPGAFWRRIWPAQWGRPVWTMAGVGCGVLVGLAFWLSAGNRLSERLADARLGQGSGLAAVLASDELTFPAFAQNSAASEDSEP